MGRHRSLKRAQRQHRGLRIGGFTLQHVETNPVVFQHAIMQQLHRLPHEIVHRSGGLIDAVDLFLDFCERGTRRHMGVSRDHFDRDAWA